MTNNLLFETRITFAWSCVIKCHCHGISITWHTIRREFMNPYKFWRSLNYTLIWWIMI